MGLPRVRLFAAFLGMQGSGDFEGDNGPMGNNSDNDAAKREKTLMEKLLQSPHAVAIYLDLLVEIHREIIATKTWKELFKQKQMGSLAAASNEEDSKDGDGDVSSKGGEEEEGDEDEDEDEQQGGISVVSGGESVGTFGRGKKSSQAPAPPPVDPLHLHTVSLPLVMASVDVLFPR